MGRGPFVRGVQRGSSPLGREGRSTIGMLRLSLWGRIQRNRAVSWQGIQWGQSLPWHTILLARSSVLYLLRRRRRRGLATGQRKDLLATQDRRGLQAGWPKTQGLVRSKARLADKGCAGLNGAERQESTRIRAAGGI